MPQEVEIHGIPYRVREPRTQVFQYGNHPRESVSWYHAIAFTRWLSSRLGYEVTLPSEHQYERVVRWIDGNMYPYGNEFDSLRGNTSETKIGQTSPVGIFPNGISIEGVHDLCGNILEWCLNEYSNPQKIEVDPTSAFRVLRGCSWNDSRSFSRATLRSGQNPVNFSADFGFRLVCRVLPQ